MTRPQVLHNKNAKEQVDHFASFVVSLVTDAGQRRCQQESAAGPLHLPDARAPVIAVELRVMHFKGGFLVG